MTELKDTVTLLNELNSAKSIDDFNAFLNNNRNQEISFSQYYNSILAKNNIELAKAIKDSCLNKNYAYGIVNGNRKHPTKAKVLALAIAAHMSYQEVHRALKLTNNADLIPTNYRDAIVILNINKGNYDIDLINQQIYKQSNNENDLLK